MANRKELNFSFSQTQRDFSERTVGSAAWSVRKWNWANPMRPGEESLFRLPAANSSLEVEAAIVATGNGSNPLINKTTPGLASNKYGNIIADETGKTSREGVWAGGDIVIGAATVIKAMGAGKKAAAAIHEYVLSKK